MRPFNLKTNKHVSQPANGQQCAVQLHLPEARVLTIRRRATACEAARPARRALRARTPEWVGSHGANGATRGPPLRTARRRHVCGASRVPARRRDGGAAPGHDRAGTSAARTRTPWAGASSADGGAHVPHGLGCSRYASCARSCADRRASHRGARRARGRVGLKAW